MTHLSYVAATYALGLGLPLLLAVGAALRLGRARRRLAQLDPRMADTRALDPRA